MKSIFRRRYADPLFFEYDPSFAPVASWTTKNQAKQPHIMLTMRNETVLRVGDDRILRGELMALTAAICSRMAFHHFKQHAVIPVSPCILKCSLLLYSLTKHSGIHRLCSSHSRPLVLEELSRLTMTAARLSSARAGCLTSLPSLRPHFNFLCDIWLVRLLGIPKSSLRI